MSVKSVQCCQCGSPLQLPDSPSEFGLIQCQHCSALLEIQELERGSVTRLRADLQTVQAATAKHAELLRVMKVERQIAELDRQFRERWGDSANQTLEQAKDARLPLSLLLLGIVPTAMFFLPFWQGLGSILLAGVLGAGAWLYLDTYMEDRESYESQRTSLVRQLTTAATQD